MNDLKVFENEEFGTVRVVEVDGKPWFVGKDVAECLGYVNTRKAILDHVDIEDKKDGVTIRDSIGRNQLAIVISKSGMYALIMDSKLPSAKRFKHWVTSEVLPSIEEHGVYMTQDVLQKSISDPSYMIGLLTALQDEQQKSAALQEVIVEQKPKVDFADALFKAKDNINIETFAKAIKANNIDIGRNKMFKFLRNKEILGKNNLPYQKYLNSGYFLVEETVYEIDYTVRINQQTLITPKGQIWFIGKFLDELKSEYWM